MPVSQHLFNGIRLRSELTENSIDCGAEHETAEGISTDLKQRFPQYSTEIDKLSLDMHEPNKYFKGNIQVESGCMLTNSAASKKA